MDRTGRVCIYINALIRSTHNLYIQYYSVSKGDPKGNCEPSLAWCLAQLTLYKITNKTYFLHSEKPAFNSIDFSTLD